jgi:hypothetical protein
VNAEAITASQSCTNLLRPTLGWATTPGCDLFRKVAASGPASAATSVRTLPTHQLLELPTDLDYLTAQLLKLACLLAFARPHYS